MLEVLGAPSKPHLSDEYNPTNPRLWKDVLDIAQGEKRQLTIGKRTINSPNDGKGFRNMPHNPNGIAWAVKQYNGFGGNWKKKASSTDVYLEIMRQGAVLTSRPGSQEQSSMEKLAKEGLVGSTPGVSGLNYWSITAKGAIVASSGLGNHLIREMDSLLDGEYNLDKAKDLAKWLKATFRFDSPKTPKGQKDLKEEVLKVHWSLANGDEKYRSTVEKAWSKIKPRVSDLVKYFTDEGGTIVPKEKGVGANTYINDAGLDEKTMDRYIKRLEVTLHEIKGWRRKALKGGLKVVFKSPRDFTGTVSGKYKRSEDALWVRTTPSILKRGSGYASFEYIIVHELGHRYERFNQLPEDFDKPHWYTSKYSRSDGEGFAELFAISNFNLRGSWDEAVIDRFEKVIG